MHKFERSGPPPPEVSVPAACKPICKPDDLGWDETGETERTERVVLVPIRRGHRIRERSSETPETHVALLITQRSEVQILPATKDSGEPKGHCP